VNKLQHIMLKTYTQTNSTNTRIRHGQAHTKGSTIRDIGN